VLKRFAFGVLGAIAGYLIGLFGGMGLINLLSSNPHDRSVEAAMTGAFVVGPFMALVGFVIGWAAAKRRTADPNP
jgi:cation transporter-like permease